MQTTRPRSSKSLVRFASVLMLVVLAGSAFAQIVAEPTVAKQTTATQTENTANPALTMWYDKPAKIWMTEALPIGNGPMGAMLFGGTEVERIQFNEISLWSGDRVSKGLLGNTAKEELDNLGAHQAFGDLFIHLGHDFSKVTQYRRQLDIDRAVHSVEYVYEGTRFQQTAFASHPAGVIVIQLTADKPGKLTGQIQLADMHNAQFTADENRLTSMGKLKNGMQYEAQVFAKHKGGALAIRLSNIPSPNPWKIKVPEKSLSFDKCDSLTFILGAGTNFLQDHSKGWIGEDPHEVGDQPC